MPFSKARPALLAILSASLLLAACQTPSVVPADPLPPTRFTAPEAVRPCIRRPSWMEPRPCPQFPKPES